MRLTVTTIIFGLPTGQRIIRTCLTLPTARLTVRELIAQKVQREVEAYRTQQQPRLSGEYLASEILLRAPGAEAFVPGDAATEVARAQRAFASRSYMIVIDDRRLFDLEDVVTLHPGSRIEFIKILPLVGG